MKRPFKAIAEILIDSAGWVVFAIVLSILIHGWTSDCPGTAGVYLPCYEESK